MTKIKMKLNIFCQELSVVLEVGQYTSPKQVTTLPLSGNKDTSAVLNPC